MSVITSLVAYYSLEEISGTRNDAHSNNHLSDNNTVTSGTGKVGTAASFTAANTESLSVADNATLSMPGDISISAWVKATALGLGTVRRIASKDDQGAQREYSLYLGGSSNPTFEGIDSSSGFASAIAAAISADTWAFLIGTYTNGDKTFRLYVDDGTEAASSPLTNGMADRAAPFVIGAASDLSSQPMDGQIDEVAVWRKVLTPAERTWLYNSGNGRDYAAIVAEAAPTFTLIGRTVLDYVD